MERERRFVSLGAAMALVCAVAATASGQTETTVVMTGLDNPRGLAFGPEGALYVAEAGRGGNQPCVVVRAGQPVPVFAGPTGAVSRLWRDRQTRVATGLPSFTENAPGAPGATGPHDITFLGRGNARVSVGLGGEPTFRDSCQTIGPGFGQLVKVPASGKWRNRVDVTAHEEEENPDGGAVDSNPYGLLAEPGATLVTDAGANALLRVAANQSISTVAVFPSRSTGRVPFTDAVPTSVVRGPDGAYYVGELTGAPFLVGEANVYRVVPSEAPAVFLDGFTAIIDIAFAPDGALWVLQFATGPGLSGPGALIRVDPDGTRTTVASAGLLAPTSVAVGPDGALYVSNCGVFPGTGPFPCDGHVLRIEP